MQTVDVLIFSDDNGWLGFARYAGAYRIATELRSSGFSVQVVDFFGSMSEKQILAALDKFVGSNTLYVGFATTLWVKSMDWRKYVYNSYEAHLSSLFPHDDSVMLALFTRARELNPKIRFVIGGSKAESIKGNEVDYWVVGQGEGAAVYLAKTLRDNRVPESRILNGRLYPFDTFSKSTIDWVEEDHVFQGEALPIEIARGCIFRCSFCYYPLNGKKKNEYVKDMDVLRTEILRNKEKYNTSTYLFTDDLLNDSLEKVRSLNATIRSLPFDIEWSSYCRLDLIHKYPEMAQMLLDCGARSIFFGIETLDVKAGARAGKGLGADRIKETLNYVKSVWKERVLISAGFIIGLPGETRESIERTLSWLLREDCPIDVADVGVLSIKNRSDLKDIGGENSRIGEDPSKFGIQMTPLGWRHESLDSEAAFELARNFYESPEFLKKKRGAPLTMYPRLRNIGYSFDEIRSVEWSKQSFVDEAMRRRRELADVYFSRVLA